MRIFGKGSHHLPPIGIFYSIILALRDLGSGCLPEHLYSEGSIKYCRKYKNENCSHPAEYHLWAHSPLHQRPVPSHGHHCRGFLPAACQVNVDHIVTSSPLYKPHPLLSRGMACQQDNFLNFLSRNIHLIASLLHQLNVISIWLTTEPHQENSFHYSFPCSMLCQTEAPSVQLFQYL